MSGTHPLWGQHRRPDAQASIVRLRSSWHAKAVEQVIRSVTGVFPFARAAEMNRNLVTIRRPGVVVLRHIYTESRPSCPGLMLKILPI